MTSAYKPMSMSFILPKISTSIARLKFCFKNLTYRRKAEEISNLCYPISNNMLVLVVPNGGKLVLLAFRLRIKHFQTGLKSPTILHLSKSLFD